MPHERVWIAARADFVVANHLERTAVMNALRRLSVESLKRSRRSSLHRFNALTSYELWYTTMALGIISDPHPDCVLYSRGASRTPAFAGVCFSAIVAAPCRNGKSSAAGVEIWAAVGRPFARTGQSRTAALGLYV